MANVKLGDTTFEGVTAVKLNTTDGDTVTFSHVITVTSADELPTDAEDGTIAIVGGE